VKDVGFTVELKNLSFAYWMLRDAAFRSGVPVRGGTPDAVSFTHRLSGPFYIDDFIALILNR
jgi:hypothetical protein